MSANLPFHEFSIAAILDGYRAKTLSPVDVAQWCADAYAAAEPHVHAWECFDADRLMEAALESTARARGVGPGLEFCPSCEMPLLPAAEFCSNCGVSVRATLKVHPPSKDAAASAGGTSSEGAQA